MKLKVIAAGLAAFLVAPLGAPATNSEPRLKSLPMPLEELRAKLGGLAAGNQTHEAASVALTIKAWQCGVNAHVTFSLLDENAAIDPLSYIFKNAESPAWCAASIVQFLITHKDSLPEKIPITDLLPLWWMSVHPDALPHHKRAVEMALKVFKKHKEQQAEFLKKSKPTPPKNRK